MTAQMRNDQSRWIALYVLAGRIGDLVGQRRVFPADFRDPYASV
jgi:hypothetical protein